MPFPPPAVAADKTDNTDIPSDHPNHHNELATAVNDITSEIQTWTVNRDANTFGLTDLGAVEIGPTAALANPNLNIDRDRTTVAAGNYHEIRAASTTTFNTVAGGNYNGLAMLPIIGGDANISTVNGILFQPAMNPNVTITTARAGNFSLSHGVGTLSTGIGIRANISESLGTLTLGVGVDIESANTLGTFTTMVGLRITALNGGDTKWAMQVGDYQSQHIGKLGLGGATSSTAPVYGLDLMGTAQDRGVIGLVESVATPTNPAASAGCVVYMKADKFVIGYLDGATMRYKYLDLTGTGVTWVHSTTAP